MLPPNASIYISGPMTGYPEYNYPAFNEMAKTLRGAGFRVNNPAEVINGDTSHPRRYYMRLDIELLLKSDSMLLLPGWRKSKGALLEYAIAEELGYPIFDDAFQPIGESICEEADRIVSSDRGDDYGHPFHDFTRTGRIWGAILDIPDVTPEQVGMCMMGVKISRHCNKPKRDNMVDSAGYAKTVQMVADYKKAHNIK